MKYLHLIAGLLFCALGFQHTAEGAFRSSAETHQNSSVSTTIAAAMPAGVVAGDQLLAITNWDSSFNTITPPSGWTEIGNLNPTGPDGQTVKLYTKVATGSEGSTQTWSGPTKAVTVIIAAWSGRDATALTSAQVVTTSNTAGNMTPVSASFNGITASSNDDIAVFVGLDNTASSAVWSYSAITSYTSRQTSAADWSLSNLQTRDAVSAGATGSLASTLTRTSGLGNTGYSAFVVRMPAAIPGPTITTQPSSTSVAAPATANFTVSATSTGGALSYQWQDNSSGSFANVSGGSGATSSSYTTAATNGSFNGRLYRVIVTDNNGSATSASATLTVTGAPTITSTSSATPANGSTLTISGTNLKGTGNTTVTLGGVSQTVTSQTSTAVQITVARGTNKYGAALNLVVHADNLGDSNTYTGITGLVPPSAWSYVNLGTLASSTTRITATADLASGDQLAYENKGGLVTVSSNGTFVCDPTVTSFDAEAWTTGSGWGTSGLQTIQ